MLADFDDKCENITVKYIFGEPVNGVGELRDVFVGLKLVDCDQNAPVFCRDKQPNCVQRKEIATTFTLGNITDGSTLELPTLAAIFQLSHRFHPF